MTRRPAGAAALALGAAGCIACNAVLGLDAPSRAETSPVSVGTGGAAAGGAPSSTTSTTTTASGSGGSPGAGGDMAGAGGTGGAPSGAGGALSVGGAGGSGGGSGGAGGGERTGTPIVEVGTVTGATGRSAQTHVVYATGSGRWWIFTMESTAKSILRTYSSTDFATWEPGDSLTLPRNHNDDGRNFSVAYRSIGGVDVVHLAIALKVSSTDRERYHARGTLDGTTAIFQAAVLVNQMAPDKSGVDPDAPATVIATSGYVSDFSGWEEWTAADPGVGNGYAWRSASADTGATFANTWQAKTNFEIVTTYVNAHGGVPLAGGQVLGVYENGTATSPSNLRFVRWTGSAWTAPDDIYASNVTQDANDWGIARRTDTDVHVVRRTTTSGTFQHARFDGAAWAAGDAIPAQPSRATGGVAMASDGTTVLLAAIAFDETSIVATRWSAAGWSPWFVVASSPAQKLTIAASPEAGAGSYALIWAEGTAPTTLVGTLVPAP